MLFESPSNPMLDIVDIKAVCDLAHKAGAKVVLDNAFATPMLQRPLEWGADIVVPPPPSTSTARAARWAARCWAKAIQNPPNKLQPIIRRATPAPALEAVQCLDCWWKGS